MPRLPPSSSTGAGPEGGSALVSLGIDLRITPQISLGARFEGEFSENVTEYAGRRYEFQAPVLNRRKA